MEERRKPLVNIFIILLVFFVLVGFAWISYQYAARRQGGESFLVYWVSMRAFLVEGQSPYNSIVAERVQQVIAEHELTPQPGFRPTYPLYAGILFLPFALIPGEVLARAVWSIELVSGLILFAIACVRLTRWRMDRINLPLYGLFVILWFHSLIAISDGGMSILVGLFLAWSLLAIRNGFDELAGFLLALGTIRPLLVLLPMLFIFIWCVVHKRWKLLVWFIGSLILFIFGGMFFLTDWLLQNIQATLAALQPSYPMTPGAAFVSWLPGAGSRLGWILTLLVSLILVGEWWLAISRKEFRWLLWTTCLTLTLGQWIGIRTDAANYVMLILPITLVFAVWDERWRGSNRPYMGVLSMVISIALILGVSWAIYLNGVSHGLDFRQMPLFLFPLPLFLILTLYWVRWWAIQPRRLYVETLE